jgi:type I restriction enzyme S subunit
MELNKGYKKTDVGIIPGDWEVIEIQEVCKLINGRGFKPFEWKTEGLPIIRIQNLNGSDEFNYYDGPYDKKIEINTHQLLFAWSGSRGTSFGPHVWQGGKGLLNYHTWKVNVDENKINKDYFVHSLRVLTKKIEDSAHGASALVHVQKWQIEKVKFVVARSHKEQIAIATAISDADTLITSLEKLIAKKRNIKQGAIQHLLKPKKDWVYKRVSDISNVGRGRVISHKEIDNSIKGSYPVYSSQTSNDGIMGYIDTYDFEGEYVTWTTDGANAGTVFYRRGRFNCTNVCGTIKLHVDNPQFIALVLNLITPKYVSKNLANPKLMNDQLKRIKVPLPPVDEQNRITSIASDMEREINILTFKLEKYRQIKSGMMQNLLTGKIRLA